MPGETDDKLLLTVITLQPESISNTQISIENDRPDTNLIGKKVERCMLLFQINYSELARQYGVMEKTKLGNMVVKEFLESKGVQLSRFQQFRQERPAARRRIIRMQGGEISVPVPRTNKEIRETLMVSTVQ